MRHLTKAVLSTVAASSLLLAGCSAGASSNSSENSKQQLDVKPADFQKAEYDELKDGGTLNLSVGAFGEQMNVFSADATSATTEIWSWYNPRIGLYDDEAKWYANPNYITKVQDEVVDGKTVVTWDIEPKATFNDGTPVDWKTFEATWKANNGSDSGFISGDTDGYKDIESVTMGKDPKQVVVTYKIKYPWWKKNFEFLLHPKAAADAKTFNEGYINTPHAEWGAGPYTLKSLDATAGTVVFEKNPNWWGKPGKLDEIVLKSLRDQAEMNAFKNNQLDMIGIATKDRFEQVQGMEVNRYTSVSRSLMLLQINSKSENMSDIRVREAIFHALDRPKLVEIRYNGLNYHENPPASLLLRSFQDGYEDNLGDLGKFDAEKSKKLLDEAGWKLNGEYRQKDGKNLEIHIPQFSQNSNTQAFYGAMTAMFKSVGIKMVVDQRKPTEFASIMRNLEFDVVFSANISTNPFGMADVGQVYKSDSTLSVTSLGNAEIDKMIEKSQYAPTEAESIKFGNEAEKKAMAQVGWMPLLSGPTMVATRKGLVNLGAMGYTVMPKNMIGWKK